MDPTAQHRHLFRQLDHDISRFLELVSGTQDIAKINIQLEKLLKNAHAVEEQALIQDLKTLQADWGQFARRPSTSHLSKIQQDALRIKHEIREL